MLIILTYLTLIVNIKCFLHTTHSTEACILSGFCTATIFFQLYFYWIDQENLNSQTTLFALLLLASAPPTQVGTEWASQSHFSCSLSLSSSLFLLLSHIPTFTKSVSILEEKNKWLCGVVDFLEIMFYVLFRSSDINCM